MCISFRKFDICLPQGEEVWGVPYLKGPFAKSGWAFQQGTPTPRVWKAGKGIFNQTTPPPRPPTCPSTPGHSEIPFPFPPGLIPACPLFGTLWVRSHPPDGGGGGSTNPHSAASCSSGWMVGSIRPNPPCPAPQGLRLLRSTSIAEWGLIQKLGFLRNRSK